MSRKTTRRMTLKDKEIPARKAKNVKGGLIIPGPHVITAAGPGGGSHFTVTDSCGEWPTVITGAGPGAGPHVK